MGVQATPARLSEESAAARDMIERYHERYGHLPQTLAADTTYGNGELLQWLDERGIAAYIRVKENPGCDDGPLRYRQVHLRARGEPAISARKASFWLSTLASISAVTALTFITSTVKRCRDCFSKRAAARAASIGLLAIHTCEPARQEGTRLGPNTSASYRATGSAESGSIVRRAEELHRTAPTETTAAPDALCTRTVLPARQRRRT